MVRACSILVVLLSAVAARAGGEEIRTFSVSIDKKPAGSHRITIDTADDGTQTVTMQADVKHRVLVITYRYTFRGTEIYKNGRLLGMTTHTDDDGTKHSVTLESSQNEARLQADGKHSVIKGYFWTTTYWKLPPSDQRNLEMRLLDADNGKLLDVKFEKMGSTQISVGGRAIACTHYRIRGGTHADLWFDEEDRLVRQELLEDGHNTVLELTGLERK